MIIRALFKVNFSNFMPYLFHKFDFLQIVCDTGTFKEIVNNCIVFPLFNLDVRWEN